MLGWFRRVEMKIDKILAALQGVQQQETALLEGNKQIMADQATAQAAIDAATAQITQMTSLEQSAIAALNSTNDRIAAAVAAFQAANPGVNVDSLTAAVTAEQANATALATAITANTPAAPAPSPTPPTQ